MAYITKYQIVDKQDNNRYYKKGSEYPCKNADVSGERIKELLDLGHIEEVEGDKGQPLKEYTVKELKDIAKERNLESYTDLKKDELIELLEQE